jgi:hypothetical protein
MTTIDLIDGFYRQSIIGIDPIDVFLTIGAQLCLLVYLLWESTNFLLVQKFNRVADLEFGLQFM